MLAKDAVTHIVSLLPENMSFEEIIQALSLIYDDRYGIEVGADLENLQMETQTEPQIEQGLMF
jgi:hypothetical protein